MKYIKLTQNKRTKIDNEDFDKVNKYKWHSWYAISSKSYYAVSTNSKEHKSIYLHRIITNCPTGFLVDHINHNTLDNRKINLRICTSSQSQINRIGNKDKGVSWHKTHKLWLARIKKDNKTYYLGWFKNKKDGINVYKKKAKELFGEYNY